MLKLAAIVTATVIAAAASCGAARAAAPADPRIALLKELPPGARIEDLQPSPIPGVYQFMQGADVSYLTADGRFFIDGNIYDMRSRVNLTALRRERARAALIDAVPESQMLLFPAAHPRYTITVFTDVDCPYCRELHSRIAEINALGINVRYMFFPRTGPGTASWRKAEAVWCSPDRKDALVRAQAGANLDPPKSCTTSPVAREYALGQELGVRGTPAIFTASGGYINGYLPPPQLFQEIAALQRAGT